MVIDEEAIRETAHLLKGWIDKHKDDPWDPNLMAAATAVIAAQVIAHRRPPHMSDEEYLKWCDVDDSELP